MCKEKNDYRYIHILQDQGYLRMSALRQESNTHIKTDTMCCFNSLDYKIPQVARMHSQAYTQYMPLSLRLPLWAVENPFSHT